MIRNGFKFFVLLIIAISLNIEFASAFEIGKIKTDIYNHLEDFQK